VGGTSRLTIPPQFISERPGQPRLECRPQFDLGLLEARSAPCNLPMSMLVYTALQTPEPALMTAGDLVNASDAAFAGIDEIRAGSERAAAVAPHRMYLSATAPNLGGKVCPSG
jgi:hypothetical protein